MTTVICPYCFDRAPASRLPYRCLMMATGVRGGTPCDAEPDDVWAGFMGPGVPPSRRLRGPVFAAPRTLAALRGSATRQPCPGCGVASSVRVCRRCHSDFPSEYCDQDSRIIALVGAKASGKSTYVSVLVNELRGRVGREYNISLPHDGRRDPAPRPGDGGGSVRAPAAPRHDAAAWRWASTTRCCTG